MIIKTLIGYSRRNRGIKMKNEHKDKPEKKQNKTFLIVGIIVILILLLMFLWQNRKMNNQNNKFEEASSEESIGSSSSIADENNGTGEDVASPLLIDNFMGTFEEISVGEIANDDMGGSSKEDWTEVFGEPSRTTYNNTEDQEVVIYTWTKPVQEAEKSVLTVRFIDDMAISKSVIGLASEGSYIANTNVFERISIEGNYNYSLSKQDLGQPDGITESKTDGKNIRTVSWIAKSGDGQGANMTIIFEDDIAVEKSSSGLL